jgi:23S rRNA (adenine2030-N6)-methyltransferase
MNYRHAFHAGNHTEVFKHSVLCLLLLELRKKPNRFAVLDTHSGAGRYDLLSPETQRTGEAQDGIAIVIDKRIPSASSYLDIVRGLNPAGLHCYPGSPAIAQALLRDDDRLIACELRNDDAALLRANFRKDSRISVHRRNGYEAIGAFVPLPTRRGLVFIDPSFEQVDEFQRLADALNVGIKKWPIGIFVAWYPIKDRSGIRTLRKRYRRENPPTLCCEFIRQPLDGLTLAGSGLVICNPPWQFESKLTRLCGELALAFGARTARHSLDWWVRERR